MGNAFFVVWRESLEAFLIAGILYAWLQANDQSGRGKRALFIGLAAGVGLALMLGWALLSVQDELTGEALEIFQTATLFVAAGLITQMVLWMRKHGRQMKARLHADHLHEGLAVGAVVDHHALALLPARKQQLDAKGAEYRVASRMLNGVAG